MFADQKWPSWSMVMWEKRCSPFSKLTHFKVPWCMLLGKATSTIQQLKIWKQILGLIKMPLPHQHVPPTRPLLQRLQRRLRRPWRPLAPSHRPSGRWSSPSQRPVFEWWQVKQERTLPVVSWIFFPLFLWISFGSWIFWRISISLIKRWRLKKRRPKL